MLALDALVPLVSLSSDLAAISPADLARAFAGQIDGWAALGGPDAPLALHLPAAGSGLGQAFERQVMAPAGLAVAASVTRHATPDALAAAVAADPLALGVGAFSAQGDAQAVALAGPCGLQSEATETTLRTEDYPLTTPLFAYVAGRHLPPVARAFLAYAGSPAAQPVIGRAGFTDQFPQLIPLDRQGARFLQAISVAEGEAGLSRLKGLAELLRDRARLTVTFRFRDGSAELDAQSRWNVTLLSEALRRGVFDDRTLVFVGFSDGLGADGDNTALSRDRAQAVRDAVASARAGDAGDAGDDPAPDAAGYGEAMPLACDGVPWGRRINRRVEVWLR